MPNVYKPKRTCKSSLLQCKVIYVNKLYIYISLAGMVGAPWDLQAEGHRRGEDIDLVVPAELWPNGNRTRHVSTLYRPPGLPICSRSPAQTVSPCKGGTQAGHCSLWTSTRNGGQLGTQRIWP